MVCDNCKKNEAVLHFIQIDNNGELKKFDLCKECASELSLFSFNELEETEFNDGVSILAIDLGFFLDKLGKKDAQKVIGQNFIDDKIAMGIFPVILAFLEIHKAKEVLPMPGLAASTIRSEFCSPEVILSRSTKPVDTPVIAVFLSASNTV